MGLLFEPLNSVLSSYGSAEERGLRARISARIPRGVLIDIFRGDGEGAFSTIETTLRLARYLSWNMQSIFQT